MVAELTVRVVPLGKGRTVDEPNVVGVVIAVQVIHVADGRFVREAQISPVRRVYDKAGTHLVVADVSYTIAVRIGLIGV